MSVTVSMVAPVLRDRFQHQLIGKVKGLVEALFNAVMQQKQLFFLGCLPYERCPQRRGHSPDGELPAPWPGKPLGHPQPAGAEVTQHGHPLSLRAH